MTGLLRRHISLGVLKQVFLAGAICFSLAACIQPAPVVVTVVPITVEPKVVTVEIPVEVTRLVQAPPVEVTRVVPVTQIVVVTEIVVVQPALPVPTEAPRPTAVPPPAAPTAAPVPAAPSATEALPVWYDFEGDFVSSGVVADRSGNGHDARVYGTVEVAEGISSGQAILFSGNGYIQAASNPATGRSHVSFSLWFKTDHPENNYKLASAAWWNWGPGSGWIMATHIPEFWSDDTKGLYIPDISNNDNRFLAGEWNHEVVTYDGDHIREYTNGQLVNDWPTTGVALGQGLPMAVGAWPAFQAYNFQGAIDEFRIFDGALTQEEVQALYRQR